MGTPTQAFRRATANLVCFRNKRLKQVVRLLDSAGCETWHCVNCQLLWTETWERIAALEKNSDGPCLCGMPHNLDLSTVAKTMWP